LNVTRIAVVSGGSRSWGPALRSRIVDGDPDETSGVLRKDTHRHAARRSDEIRVQDDRRGDRIERSRDCGEVWVLGERSGGRLGSFGQLRGRGGDDPLSPDRDTIESAERKAADLRRDVDRAVPTVRKEAAAFSEAGAPEGGAHRRGREFAESHRDLRGMEAGGGERRHLFEPKA
jgi:hypothetical protein